MDIVYVIYFDGHMHKEHNRKCAYLEKKNAKQVVTEEAKGLIYDMAEKDGKDYWNLTTEEEKAYLQKARQRFEIREFVETKDSNTLHNLAQTLNTEHPSEMRSIE